MLPNLTASVIKNLIPLRIAKPFETTRAVFSTFKGTPDVEHGPSAIWTASRLELLASPTPCCRQKPFPRRAKMAAGRASQMASRSDGEAGEPSPGERSLSLITLGRRGAGRETAQQSVRAGRVFPMCNFVQFNPYAA